MGSDGQHAFRIGELAAHTRLTPDTLRYYERLGLLPHPPRTRGGFRLYSAATLDQVRFIRRAQTMGLTLDEIHELVTFDGRGLKRCRRVRDLVEAKLGELDARMAELRAFRRTLRHSLRECEETLSGQADAECPVVEHKAGRG